MKYNLIAQYHPAAALHQPRLWAVILDDWQHLPVKVDCSYTVIPFPKTLPRNMPNETLAFDTETNPDGTLGCWSLATRGKRDGTLYAMSTKGRKLGFDWKNNLIVMHNAKFDLRVLRKNGMKEPKNYVDTMVAAYCLGLGFQAPSDSSLDSADEMVGGLGLKYLARRHLGKDMKSWKDVFDAPSEVVQGYNMDDSTATFLLWEKWLPSLPKHFWEIDTPLTGTLMAMEDRGIQVDPKFLSEYGKMLDEKLAEIDLPLNPNSPDELQSYVYGTLMVEPWKFTEGGKPSVAEEVLEVLDDPVVKNILNYKALSKEKGTYIDNYTASMDAEHRIHCEFKQTRTATGRLASARPNLQNVPKRDDSVMRKLFIAPKGKKLIRLDWWQIELLVFGALTGEPAILKAYKEGRSIHKEMAEKTKEFGMDYDETKVADFLMLYKGGEWKLSQEFHIPIDRAKEMVAGYYKMFPSLAVYHEQQQRIAQNDKKVVNWFGRTRRLDAMYTNVWKVRQEGIREAINTPIQSCAGDIVKRAMNDLHYKHSAPMLLQVHDELIFEVATKEVKEYAQWLKEYVPTITEINGIRFPVEVGIGKNWLESAKKENQI